MIHLYHGADTFSLGEAVAALKAQLLAGDPLAELNFSTLDGRRLTLGELQTAADAVPFMGSRRVVVVHGLVTRLNPQGGGESAGRGTLADGLKAWLPTLADSTDLILADTDVHRNNPILRWIETWRAAQPVPDAAASLHHFPAPKADALPRWLSARAVEKGGRIMPPAASALAAALDRAGEVDLRLADNELEKLLVYAGERPVTAEDVADLVTPVSLEKVFALTDALAARDGPTAATLLHTLLANNEPPLRLLALVARQFRQLIAVRALLDGGLSAGDLPEKLGLQPFVARKLSQQVRRFSGPFLFAALKQLLLLESAIKTGQMDADLALDLFVAGVCGVARP